MQSLSPVIKSGLSVVKYREPLTGTEWANKYFYLSPESSGIEGKWETLPYQIGPSKDGRYRWGKKATPAKKRTPKFKTTPFKGQL